MDSIDIEQVQAWILLAIYEFMRTNYRRAWKTAGRAFRLVQLMTLYRVDVPNSPNRERNGTVQADWIETEERRRIFWMAYILDRFVSIRDEWPLTINEQVVRVSSLSPQVTCDCVCVQLNPTHPGFHPSTCSRKGLSERQAGFGRLSVRSNGCQRPHDPFFLHRMYHLGHHLRTQHVA